MLGYGEVRPLYSESGGAWWDEAGKGREMQGEMRRDGLARSQGRDNVE